MMNWDDPLGTGNNKEEKKPQPAEPVVKQQEAKTDQTTDQANAKAIEKEAPTVNNVTPENTRQNAMSGVEPVRAEDKRVAIEIVAHEFDSVEIHGRAVIAKKIEAERFDERLVIDAKGRAEVGGDPAWRGALFHDGGFVFVAEAENRRTSGPEGVVEARADPGSLLI